eukprot:scaffold73711_cov40-Tisochrysis_lutea.AAC.4
MSARSLPAFKQAARLFRSASFSEENCAGAVSPQPEYSQCSAHQDKHMLTHTHTQTHAHVIQVQASVLRRSPEIVVATPGRLIDHLHNTQSVGLEDLAVLVLDEADRWMRCCSNADDEAALALDEANRHVFDHVKAVLVQDETDKIAQVGKKNPPYAMVVTPGWDRQARQEKRCDDCKVEWRENYPILSCMTLEKVGRK